MQVDYEYRLCASDMIETRITIFKNYNNPTTYTGMKSKICDVTNAFYIIEKHQKSLKFKLYEKLGELFSSEGWRIKTWFNSITAARVIRASKNGVYIVVTVSNENVLVDFIVDGKIYKDEQIEFIFPADEKAFKKLVPMIFKVSVKVAVDLRNGEFFTQYYNDLIRYYHFYIDNFNHSHEKDIVKAEFLPRYFKRKKWDFDKFIWSMGHTTHCHFFHRQDLDGYALPEALRELLYKFIDYGLSKRECESSVYYNVGGQYDVWMYVGSCSVSLHYSKKQIEIGVFNKKGDANISRYIHPMATTDELFKFIMSYVDEK